VSGFDWRAFLDRAGVYFVEKEGGQNIYTKCPFCGIDDPSEHLGINVDATSQYLGFWGCWRAETHKGRSPVALVSAILRCSGMDARKIVAEGATASLSPISELEAQLNALGTKPARQPIAMPATLPEQFSALKDKFRYRGRFFKYLRGRGFARDELVAVSEAYNLQGAVTGHFRDRIIFPFYKDEELIGWTARAIVPAKQRYDTYFESDEAPAFIFNCDCAYEPAETLIIVEGPIDAVKMDFYGRAHGARTCGLLGRNLNAAKVQEIAYVADEFERIVLLLDADARAVALQLKRELTWIGKEVVIIDMLDDVEDPGEMHRHQVEQLLASF